MKKLFLLLTLSFSLISFSQGFSVDVGVGASFPGGDSYEDTQTGFDLKLLQVNYKFTEQVGVTASLASSAHGTDYDDSTISLGRFTIGPSYTLPLGGINWEIKPQIVLGSSGVVDSDGYEVDIDKASGFVFGNSILLGESDGLQFLANLDYITGKIKEIEGVKFDVDNGYSFLNIGLGVRYNF